MTALDKIRARLEAATPGSLSVERRDQGGGEIMYVVHGGKDFAWCRDELDPRAKANAALIAHAPEDLRRLLDALTVTMEALEEVNRHCVCDRFKTKGFDYGEAHPLMGKPKAGARWLTPQDIARAALASAGERLGEGE